jgi:hypothetical protein
LQRKYSKLRALGCRELIAIDTEYVSRPGEHVVPVCVCAKSLFTSKTWRIWHRTVSSSPFNTNPEIVYIAYSATAEWSYFLSCGWDLPRSIIDLNPERSLEINGRKEPDGTRPSRKLLGAMEAHGIRTRDEVSKDLNIQLILRGAPYTAQERERILDYCIDDGRDTPRMVRLIIGNPLIMQEMAKRVPDVGSYAPVTVLVDERPDGVHISYDRMASLLAPYRNPEALVVARDLDKKVEALLYEAAG